MIASPLSGNILGSVGDAFVIAECRTQAVPRTPRLIDHCMCTRDDEAWYVL